MEDGVTNIIDVKSITKATMIKFINVPIPGFCFKKNQINNTSKLIIKSATPVDKLVLSETPSDKTRQGELPEEDIINKPSPKLIKKSPINK